MDTLALPKQVRQHWSRWATALGAIFFLEIFLCLVIYMYIMGLVSGHWLLLEPAGSWRAKVGLEGLSGFEENNSVIFITTCFFLILKYGKIKIYRNLFNPGLVTIYPGRVSGLSCIWGKWALRAAESIMAEAHSWMGLSWDPCVPGQAAVDYSRSLSSQG